MAWQPNLLLKYYSDRINIYDDERFIRLPTTPSPPAPPVIYIHRTTQCGQPYPIPYYQPPHPRCASCSTCSCGCRK